MHELWGRIDVIIQKHVGAGSFMYNPLIVIGQMHINTPSSHLIAPINNRCRSFITLHPPSLQCFVFVHVFVLCCDRWLHAFCPRRGKNKQTNKHRMWRMLNIICHNHHHYPQWQEANKSSLVKPSGLHIRNACCFCLWLF